MNHRGFLLIEVSITAMVLAFGVAALMSAFVLTLKANKASEQMKVATQLSTALLEEIRLHRWDSFTPTPSAAITQGSAVLGPDSGEVATDKRMFNDIDDFNGWRESAVLDPMMQPLAGFPGYSRSVTVSYVTAALVTSASPTDYKQVTVCTLTPKNKQVCLNTLFTNR